MYLHKILWTDYSRNIFVQLWFISGLRHLFPLFICCLYRVRVLASSCQIFIQGNADPKVNLNFAELKVTRKDLEILAQIELLCFEEKCPRLYKPHRFRLF